MWVNYKIFSSNKDEKTNISFNLDKISNFYISELTYSLEYKKLWTITMKQFLEGKVVLYHAGLYNTKNKAIQEYNDILSRLSSNKNDIYAIFTEEYEIPECFYYSNIWGQWKTT